MTADVAGALGATGAVAGKRDVVPGAAAFTGGSADVGAGWSAACTGKVPSRMQAIVRR